tara:strand:+ start:2803 stop:3123 length:321 start_codon:yes stop_codon:yes gene_type:complete
MDKRKTSLIKQLRVFKKKLMSKHNIDNIIFFGSRAQNKHHKDSDVDLIIVSKEFKGKSALKRSPKFYLEWDLNYPVDFLCYTPKEFNKLKKQVSIVSEALREGIEV